MNYRVRKKSFNRKYARSFVSNYSRARARYYANSHLSRSAKRSIFS